MLVNHGIIIIAETICFTCVHSFPIISFVEALKLIHTCIECTYSLYPHIQLLAFEYNSYALAVFIVERRFVVISFWIPHISPFLVWSIWNKGEFVIRSYMVSTHIHLYLSFLIWRMWHIELTHMVIISVRYSHPACVPVRS